MLDEITIQVTADDISKGERKNCSSCPIALAACRVFEVPVRIDCFEYFAQNAVMVTSEEITCFGRTGMDCYPLPQEASDFVNRFDKKENVAPFTFTVKLGERRECDSY